MSRNEESAKVEALVKTYIRTARAELAERWNNWSIDLEQTEVHEVIGGLIARQVTLATQLASAPSMWNGHIAPMILRTMTETHITLAWIFCDPKDRARKFILYGLGQEKLQLEHRKAELQVQGIDPTNDSIVQAKEAWINAQRYTFFTEVNVGSWSGVDTRTMASEAGCSDIYNFAYTPFSAATHSMWHHISRYNLIQCMNPLHGYHRVPTDPETEFADPDFFYRAAKYVEKSFKLFDEKTSVSVESPSAFAKLDEDLNQFAQTGDGNHVLTEQDE